jgi:NADH dehydrogenase
MTVMVTGASGLIGRSLVQALVGRDEVRACVRRPESADALRALGAKVAVGRLEDADALAEVLKGVYSLIHLIGGPNQPDSDALLAANHASTLTALAAAREAGVRRFLLMSVPGAHPDADQPFLRAKGLAEEAVTNSGLQHAIIRSTHAYGLGGLWFTAAVEGALASPSFMVGDGEQEIAPVWADDVAAVLAAADDRESNLAGTWGLEGPDVVTALELHARLITGASSPLALAPAQAVERLTSALGVPVSITAVEHLAARSRADAPDAAAEFGVALTPLETGLRLTMERVAAAGR